MGTAPFNRKVEVQQRLYSWWYSMVLWFTKSKYHIHVFTISKNNHATLEVTSFFQNSIDTIITTGNRTFSSTTSSDDWKVGNCITDNKHDEQYTRKIDERQFDSKSEQSRSTVMETDHLHPWNSHRTGNIQALIPRDYARLVARKDTLNRGEWTRIPIIKSQDPALNVHKKNSYKARTGTL
jgi:hypothetical protein